MMAGHLPEDFLLSVKGASAEQVVEALIPALRSLAHGLNTPIGSLTLDIGSLHRSVVASVPDVVEATEILENMKEACERLSSLVAEVFTATDAWRS